MQGWTPDWVPCVRIDLPMNAAPREAFELTTALDPILAALERSVTGHMMFALSPRALEAFERHGFGATLIRLHALADARQIEFVGASADDALLPLLPEREVRRQLQIGQDVGRRIFGDFYSPWLLWPPALATSPRVARIASRLGYTGMLVDELAMRDAKLPWPGDRVESCARLPGFHLLPSSRQASRAFAEGRVRHHDHWAALGLTYEQSRRYVVTTLHLEPSRKPRPLLTAADLGNTVRAVELLKTYPLSESIAPLPSSWYSRPQELHEGLPFATWHAPDNRLHALQWQLALRMLTAVESLFARGLGPHPAAQALRAAVDHGWRRSWWEAASRAPIDHRALVEGLEARRQALALARPLFDEATRDGLEQAGEALAAEIRDDGRDRRSYSEHSPEARP